MIFNYLKIYYTFFIVIIYSLIIVFLTPFLYLINLLIFLLGSKNLLIFYKYYIIKKIINKNFIEDAIDHCEYLICEIEKEENNKKNRRRWRL